MYLSLLQYLDCRKYEDDEDYLVVEPSIKCTDGDYLDRLYLVISLFVVVALGFPLSYYRLLRSQAGRINPTVLGKYRVLGEEMAAANLVFADHIVERKKSQRKPTRSEESDGNADDSATAEDDKGGDSRKESNWATKEEIRAKNMWRSKLAAALHLHEDDEELKSHKHDECTDLIKRAYQVQLEMAGPEGATHWLQECRRDTDRRIQSSKFLWGPVRRHERQVSQTTISDLCCIELGHQYWPRYWWLELFEIARKFTLTGLPALIRLWIGADTGIDVGMGMFASSAFAAYYQGISPYRSEFDLASMR